MKIITSILLISIIVFLQSQDSKIKLPFIPPLVHYPQMSLPSLGNPPMPLHSLLPKVQMASRTPPQKAEVIQKGIHNEILHGKELRLQMQSHTQELLFLLPSSFSEQAKQAKERNSSRIGEVWIWEQLQ